MSREIMVASHKSELQIVYYVSAMQEKTFEEFDLNSFVRLGESTKK